MVLRNFFIRIFGKIYEFYFYLTLIERKVKKLSKIFYFYKPLHSWNPPPPFIKGGEDRTFQELSHLGGVPKILLERGDNPEKGGLM